MRRTPLAGVVLVAVTACACTMHKSAVAPRPLGGGAGPVRPRIAFSVPQVPAAPDSPPLSLRDPEGASLELTAFSAKTRLEGPLAETELHLTFHNPERRIREGRFRVVLPRGAFVSRLAMKIDGVFREADVAELARAREVYENVMHVRRDPLLVEQHGDDELSARVFPIPPDGDKEIIVSWIGTVGSGGLDPLPLGAAKEIARVETSGKEGAAARHGDLLVARVVIPDGGDQPTLAAIDRGLVVLVDTSASRGPELDKQLALLKDTLSALASDAPAVPLTVAAFDQEVVVVHRGPLATFGDAALTALRAHGAMGASDLDGALAWTRGEARATGATRVVVLGDGLATAGPADLARLRGAARALATEGVDRLDVIGVGEVRAENIMRTLAVGALPHDGMVIDGTRPPREIAHRLTQPSRSQIQVSVPGAKWVWPNSFDGVQPGDERFVYAEVPGSSASVVHVDGHASSLSPVTAPAATLARAIAKAKVDALVAQGDARGYDTALHDRIVSIAKSKRVPSPFTAFLVTESEADRAALLRPAPPRVAAPPPPPPPPAPPPAPVRAASSGPSSSHGRVMSGHVAKVPMIRSASIQVNGRMPSENIQQVVRQNFGRFRACYELGLLRRGRLEGRVSTKFVVDLDGSVRSAADAGSDMADSDVIECVVNGFRQLHFSPLPDGGIVTVTYPIVFLALDNEHLEAAQTEMRANERSLFPRERPPPYPYSSTPLFSSEPPPPPPPPAPWRGVYADARAALANDDPSRALALASAAHARDSRDVIALVALGEALEAAALPAFAARAYGSIADLYPHDAEMLRVAAGRLDALGKETLPLAIELWRRAKDDRPDHPAGHHALAMALLRAGAYEQAFDTLIAASAMTFDGRYGRAHEVIGQDLAFVATGWATAEPARASTINARAQVAIPAAYAVTEPTLRFVLLWESDASDLELSLMDATGAPLGAREASASDGYGPEASVLRGGRASATTARVRFVRQGPTGLPMGIVHVMECDGRGHVSVRPRPFVVMNEGADVDVGAFD